MLPSTRIGIPKGFTKKTSLGRGGYVKAVYISGVTLKNVQIAIEFNGQYRELLKLM